MVKTSNSQEQVTLSERMEELEEEVNIVSIDRDKEGQKNNSAEMVSRFLLNFRNGQAPV